MTPKQWAMYIRTSTPEQALRGTSMFTQEERCRQRALELGLKNEPKYFWKETESGADMNRPMMTEMREVVRTGSVDYIFVYVYDRLSRDPIDTLGSVDICICNRCAGPFHVIPSAGKHEWP